QPVVGLVDVEQIPAHELDRDGPLGDDGVNLRMAAGVVGGELDAQDITWGGSAGANHPPGPRGIHRLADVNPSVPPVRGPPDAADVIDPCLTVGGHARVEYQSVPPRVPGVVQVCDLDPGADLISVWPRIVFGELGPRLAVPWPEDDPIDAVVGRGT